jgi:hypothetical protein
MTTHYLGTLRVLDATRTLDGHTGEVTLTTLPGGGTHVLATDATEALSLVIPPSLLDEPVVVARGPVQHDETPRIVVSTP